MPKLRNKTRIAKSTDKGAAAQAALNAILDEAISEQLRRILDAVQNMIDDEGSIKAKSAGEPISFRIHLEELTKDFGKISFRTKADSKSFYKGVSGAAWIGAASASREARKALNRGQIDEALRHFASAERSIGTATSLAQHKTLESALAVTKAHASHARTRNMRKKVIEHWKKNIPPTLSAPKAADAMLGLSSFRWPNGEDVAHGKLAEYVREGKKELAAAKKS